jgi:CheY-like chemotaxis protein
MITRPEFSILCVDDDTSILGALSKLLRSAGYDTELAKNGFVALQKVNQNPRQFQAIITDLRMPGMDGFALVEQCRRAGYGGPFVIYAGMISPESRQQLHELGVHRVIAKPGSADELVSTLREIEAAAEFSGDAAQA